MGRRHWRIGARVDAPLFRPEQVEQLVTVVKESAPVAHGLPGWNWSIKKVQRWVKQVFGCEISRRSLCLLLQVQELSRKKCQKVLKKADPQRRAAYMQAFQTTFAQVCRKEVRLVYIDESHFHRDMDLGYTWAEKGKRAWRLSDCPSLQERIDWYGAYDFSHRQCFIWNQGGCNGENTARFLQQFAAWLSPAAGRTLIIWDGAPCHKARLGRMPPQPSASPSFRCLPTAPTSIPSRASGSGCVKK
jgi:hypothetical protein